MMTIMIQNRIILADVRSSYPFICRRTDKREKVLTVCEYAWGESHDRVRD